MMDIAEGVLSTAAKEILGSYRVTWLGNEIDLTPGWKRMTMIDAVREYVAWTLRPSPTTRRPARPPRPRASIWRLRAHLGHRPVRGL